MDSLVNILVFLVLSDRFTPVVVSKDNINGIVSLNRVCLTCGVFVAVTPESGLYDIDSGRQSCPTLNADSQGIGGMAMVFRIGSFISDLPSIYLSSSPRFSTNL